MTPAMQALRQAVREEDLEAFCPHLEILSPERFVVQREDLRKLMKLRGLVVKALEAEA